MDETLNHRVLGLVLENDSKGPVRLWGDGEALSRCFTSAGTNPRPSQLLPLLRAVKKVTAAQTISTPHSPQPPGQSAHLSPLQGFSFLLSWKQLCRSNLAQSVLQFLQSVLQFLQWAWSLCLQSCLAMSPCLPTHPAFLPVSDTW